MTETYKVKAQEKITFAVLGAGNGGQAMAGYLSQQGHAVKLWNRSKEKVDAIKDQGGIRLEGQVEGFGKPLLVTTDVGEAAEGAEIIMVALPASAHGDVARLLAPHLVKDQIVVLNPGRTGGALAFRRDLLERGCTPQIVIAETNTFVFASRTVSPGTSHVFGIKKQVTVASLPAYEIGRVTKRLRIAFPQFEPGCSVLFTSLDNMGAVFHPLPTVLNAPRVEYGERFEHYMGGISPAVARVLEQLDGERVAIGEALGVKVRSALSWLTDTYGVGGNSLYEAIQQNKAYAGIYGPDSLDTRYIFEDVPFSLVPLASLAQVAGVATPVIRSAVDLACGLTGQDYWAKGRNAKSMGISTLSPGLLVSYVTRGA